MWPQHRYQAEDIVTLSRNADTEAKWRPPSKQLRCHLQIERRSSNHSDGWLSELTTGLEVVALQRVTPA